MSTILKIRLERVSKN